MQELLNLDFQILNFLYQWTARNSLLTHVISAVAVYGVYTVPLILLIFYFFKSKKDGLLALFCGIYSWVVLANLISALYFRERPSLTPLGFSDPLFHRPQTTFPSEHSSFLFSISFLFLWEKYRTWGYFFLVVAILTSLARMAVGIHFPLDILAGMVTGIISSLLFYFGREILYQFLIAPILKILARLKL